MPTDLHADAMHISVEELVRRALAVAGDRVMCDGDLIAICADVLYRLSENCQQDGEAMMWLAMWLNDFSKFKHYIIEHIDLPSGLTVDELARKAVAALGYDFVAPRQYRRSWPTFWPNMRAGQMRDPRRLTEQAPDVGGKLLRKIGR